MCRVLFCIIALGWAVLGDSLSVASVVINEMMIHPAHEEFVPEDLGAEFLELYNPTGEVIDLSGWSFTRGLRFVFPGGTVLAGEDYLIVAADPARFRELYPGVETVLGPWEGRLSNAGETLTLKEARGKIVDELSYTDDGDWSVRELGPLDHEHRGWIWSKLTDGGGHSLELSTLSLSNEHGVLWQASAAAGGTPGRANSRVLFDVAPVIKEVQHVPLIPNPTQTVQVSARLIDESETGLAAVLCYRQDTSEHPGSGILPLRDTNAFLEVPMVERGGGLFVGEIPAFAQDTIVEFYVRAWDAAGNERTWPAPALVDGNLEQITNALYRVDGEVDAESYWSPGSQPLFYMVVKQAELTELYDIGDKNYDGPFFGSEAMSNAQMNLSLIAVDGTGARAYYRAGARNRGNRSRARPPMSFRLVFPQDDAWRGRKGLNLNGQYTPLQVMGSVLFRLAGLAAAQATAVQVRVNGEDLTDGYRSLTYGSYAALENLDGVWAEHHFPADASGNLYRCRYYDDGYHPRTFADLDYKEDRDEEPDPNDYRDNYPKKTNASAQDWSDVFHLIDVLNNPDITDAEFMTATGTALNHDKWARYFATDALIGNAEGGLGRHPANGDDYGMYRGMEDPRFWLVPHDLDTVLGQGSPKASPTSDLLIYGDVDGLERLVHHPDMQALYYDQLWTLSEELFTPEIVGRVADYLLGAWAPGSLIESMKNFVAERRTYVRDQVQAEVSPLMPVPPQTPSGLADKETVRSLVMQVRDSYVAGVPVIVRLEVHEANGSIARDLWDGQATLTVSDPQVQLSKARIDIINGQGNALVTLTGAAADIRLTARVEGLEVSRRLECWNETSVREVAGVVGPNSIWDGLVLVTENVIIPADVTLTVAPGTLVLFADRPTEKWGLILEVEGTLVCTGTSTQPVTFTALDPNAPWGQILHRSGSVARYDYTHITRAGKAKGEGHTKSGPALRLYNAQVQAHHAVIADLDGKILQSSGESELELSYCHLARSVMGPEIKGTALLLEHAWITEMLGENDNDGLYIHRQEDNQAATLRHCTFAFMSDDGLDTLRSTVTVENCLIRDCVEKGVTVYGGSVSLANMLLIDNGVGISTKGRGDDIAEVTLDHATIVAKEMAIEARDKYGEPNVVINYYVTNSVLQAPLAVRTDYDPATIFVEHSLLSQPWPGVGNCVGEAAFADASAHDYRLSPESIGYRAAADGGDMGQVFAPMGGGHSSQTFVFADGLCLFEILVMDQEGKPGWIELYNDDVIAKDLGGMSLARGTSGRDRYVFPEGSTIAARALVTYSLSELGWSLDPWGDTIVLRDREGQVIDTFTFGAQIPGLSLGRLGGEGTWNLTVPSPAAENVPQPLGDRLSVKINEWLASERITFRNDYIELYNPDNNPVAVGGMSLTDNLASLPQRSRIPAFSFIAGQGFLVFDADDGLEPGHLNFKLSSWGEVLALVDESQRVVDRVIYAPQTTDVSEGRSPDGADRFASFTLPTPGLPNPQAPVAEIVTLLPLDQTWRYYQDGAAPADWQIPAFDDSTWLEGPGLLYVEKSSLPGPKNTELKLGELSYYFRTKVDLPFAPAEAESWHLSTVVDDGAIIYVNGTEVLRLHMPDGPVDHDTRAAETISNAGVEGPFEIPASVFQAGTNTIAVEVHQTNSTSSDIVWGLNLEATKAASGGTDLDALHRLREGLRITELMYHAPNGRDYDYLECMNIASAPLDVTGVRIIGGIDFVFAPLTLDPGQRVVVAADSVAFAEIYGFDVPVAGNYQGKLSNSSDSLVLRLPAPYEAAILRFRYQDDWYPSTDGQGDALSVADPTQSPGLWDNSMGWKAMAPTPGQ